MKIIIVTNGLLPVPATKGGGAETLVQNILDQNEVFHKTDFVVYSVYDEEAEKRANNYKYTEFRFIPAKIWGPLDVFYLTKHFIKKKILRHTIYRYIYDFGIVLKELEKERFDYIVLENTLIPFEKFVNLYEDKVFVHIHNELFKPTDPKTQRDKYVELINKSGGVITVSEYIKEYSSQIGNVKTDKFHVLLNSVDISCFKGETTIDSEILKEIHNNFSFVFMGRICKEKGVVEVINAFKKLKGENLRLVIIGKIQSDSKDEYINKVNNLLNTDDRIIVTGYVEHYKIGKYLKVAKCAVLPSICNDSCPLTIIESMASSLPIISTNNGGIPEEVDNTCAILLENNECLEAELAKAMRKLINSPETLNNMSISADKRTQPGGGFDLNSFYDRFIAILGEK